MEHEKFLTVAQTAERLNIGRRTIYRLIESKEIPAVQIGQSWRIPESWLNDLFKRPQPQ